MKPALMIVDMQKEYFEGYTKESMTSASEYINEVLGYFREKQLPVIWVQDIDRGSGVVPDTKGFEIIELLKTEKNEHIIFKEYGNSFNKTECKNILKNENIDTVFITGYCAEHCILATYIGAKDNDLTPFLVKKAIAGGDKENLMFVEKTYDTVTYNMIRKILENL